MKIKENNKEYIISIKNGHKYYYHNNKLHRESGPAIEFANGSKAWYFNGKQINCKSQADFENKIKNLNKKMFDIKLEALIPATIHYRIEASSPEEAFTLLKKHKPNKVNYKLIGKKDIKLIVFEAGSTLIKLIKKFL